MKMNMIQHGMRYLHSHFFPALTTLLACGTVHAATTVPGLIQMEDYDQGGEGVGYHDTTPGNQGGAYRNDDVDVYDLNIFGQVDAGVGYLVKPVSGEWLSYTINAPASGVYRMVFCFYAYRPVGEPLDPGTFHIECNGVHLSGTVGMPQWVLYDRYLAKSIAVDNMLLNAGQQTIKVVFDDVKSDNVYVDYFRVLKQANPQVRVVAGSGQTGFQDGAAGEARFSSQVSGMDVDGAGNIYLADAGNLRVRKVDTAGNVTTFAGTGQAGTADGPGAQAQFSNLVVGGNSIGVDVGGNVYVLDSNAASQTNKIRKITPQQEVSTFYQMNSASGQAKLSALAVIKQDHVVCISETNGGVPYQGSSSLLEFSPTQQKTIINTTYSTGAQGYQYYDLASTHGDDWAALQYSYSMRNYGRGIMWNGTNYVEVVPSNSPVPAHPAIDASKQVYFLIDQAIYTHLPEDSLLLKVYENAGLTGPLAVDGQGNLLTMVSNKVVRLVMNEVGYSVVADAPGGGTVELTPPAGSYPANTTISAKAQPASGWSFLHWASDVSGTINPTNVVLTSDKRITAVFGAPVAITAAHATVTRTPDQALYEYGTKVTVQVTPDEGYEFTGWSDGNTHATRELTVTELINLSANVAALPAYTITAQALGGIGGQVELVPNRATYYRDTVVTLTARPQAGYVFQVWLDNVLSNPRTITVTSNTTLFAVFATGEGVVPTVQLTGVPTTSVNLGSRVEVVAQATGSSPLEYTWKHNGTTMSTKGATLVIESVQSADLGSYEVEVSNGNGKANASFTLSASGCINIQSIQMNEQHQPVLTVCSPAGMACVLQYSADMGSWQDGVTFTNASGTMTLEAVPQGQTNYMFYRVIKK